MNRIRHSGNFGQEETLLKADTNKKKKPPTDHFHTSDIYLERGIGISPHLSLSPPLEVRYLQQSEKTLASPIDKVQMVLC